MCFNHEKIMVSARRRRIRQNHRANLTALPSRHVPFLLYDFYYTMGMECLGLLSTVPTLNTSDKSTLTKHPSGTDQSLKNEKEKRLLKSRRFSFSFFSLFLPEHYLPMRNLQALLRDAICVQFCSLASSWACSTRTPLCPRQC